MPKTLRKMIGIVILLATVGLATCQAFVRASPMHDSCSEPPNWLPMRGSQVEINAHVVLIHRFKDGSPL
jgi:hypothetical protein